MAAEAKAQQEGLDSTCEPSPREFHLFVLPNSEAALLISNQSLFNWRLNSFRIEAGQVKEHTAREQESCYRETTSTTPSPLHAGVPA